MPGNLGINLSLCFTKIKSPPQSSTGIQGDHGRPSVLTKNFNSLYESTLDYTIHSKSFTDDRLSSSASDSEDSATPDFATIFASQRFFFSSPGRSNSIIDSSSGLSMSSSLASTSSTSPGDPPEPSSIIGGSVVIPTYSPDPFLDFRRSMQEMVDAHDLTSEDVRANWDYLHELLSCYLSLNPKSTHKFIVGAFADLLVSLMTSSSSRENERLKSKFSDDADRTPEKLVKKRAYFFQDLLDQHSDQKLGISITKAVDCF